MGDGLQFLDIIFFAVIAAFLVFRLRRVLGRRDGHDGSHTDPAQGRVGHDPFVKERGPMEPSEDTAVPLPDVRGETPEEPADAASAPIADEALRAGIAQIKAFDQSFEADRFLAGGRDAFELILGGFAAGDAAALKPLLSAEVFANFSQAIRERENSKETLESTLVGITRSDMVEAYMEGGSEHVTVKFVSEQINVTRDGDGNVVDGDLKSVTEVTDFWTFARDTRSRDPNWILVATRSLD